MTFPIKTDKTNYCGKHSGLLQER